MIGVFYTVSRATLQPAGASSTVLPETCPDCGQPMDRHLEVSRFRSEAAFIATFLEIQDPFPATNDIETDHAAIRAAFNRPIRICRIVLPVHMEIVP